MTEEKPTARGKTARIGRITGLFLAALGILAVVAWLVRQPIAEMVARDMAPGLVEEVYDVIKYLEEARGFAEKLTAKVAE